jgi:sugar lactone lactonase YvrE
MGARPRIMWDNDADSKRGGTVKAQIFAGALLATVLWGTAGAAELVTVATTPSNGLEGMDVAADGSIYVTDAMAHVIHRIAPDGTLSTFAKLDVVPQVILLGARGSVVTAQQRDPDFKAMPAPQPGKPRGMSASSMGMLGAVLVELDAHGQVIKRVPGPDGAFFNGIDRFGRDYLIADSTSGRIWRYSHGELSTWLKDDALLGPDGRFPGANGIKVVAGRVYVANTVAGVIYRIGSRAGKPEGALTPVAHVAVPDDFAVARDGTIYLPSQGKVLRVAPDGSVSTLAEGCTGCDSALLTDHGHSLLLVTHGFGAGAGGGHVYKLKLQ